MCQCMQFALLSQANFSWEAALDDEYNYEIIESVAWKCQGPFKETLREIINYLFGFTISKGYLLKLMMIS